jgi:hypothetical protein
MLASNELCTILMEDPAKQAEMAEERLSARWTRSPMAAWREGVAGTQTFLIG